MAKFAVSFGVLAAVLWWAGAGDVWVRFRGMDPVWVGGAFAAVTIATFLMARRWQIVARACSIKISYRRAVGEYYIAQLGNSVLPGGVAGDVARAVRVRQEANLALAAKSILVERMLGQIAILAIMSVSFAVALILPGGIVWPVWAWAGVIGLAAGAVGGVALARSSSVLGRIAALVLRLCGQPELLFHGALIAGCLFFGFYASARATGTLIPPAAWTTLIPLILCAMLIPLSIGGWGWREAAAAALFPLIGASADAGIASGLVYGAVLLVATFPAGLVFLGQLARADKSGQRTHATHDTTHSPDPPFLPSDNGFGLRRRRRGPAGARRQSSTG
ncbi:MAG: lysylphosphatidylglycerol synthase transmembrane domain-containing protein [Pseudomonadota bacterium]